MFHYTYRITNILKNKHYYGSRSSNVPPEHDLGFIYFSSSTDTDFINDQKNNPQNYHYKVIKVYSHRVSATLLEIKLHQHFDVGNNPNFYNKARQTSTGFICNKQVGRKISKALMGKPSNKKGKTWEQIYSPLALKVMQAAASRPLSEEHKANLSATHTGKTLSNKHKHKISKALMGRDVSKSTCELLRQQKLSNHVLRNKTYDSYYGATKAAQIKAKMSKAHSGKSKPLSADGKASVQASNNRSKTKVYSVRVTSGTEYTFTLRELCDYFVISTDLAKRLIKRDKPSNKSKYSVIYEQVESIECIGTLATVRRQ